MFTFSSLTLFVGCDFTETCPGDQFDTIVEEYFKDDRFVGYGRIVAAQYKNHYKGFEVFYYRPEGQTKGKYTTIKIIQPLKPCGLKHERLWNLPMAGWVRSSLSLLIIFVLSFLICPISCPASNANNTSVWEPLIEHLIKDGEDEATIRSIFTRREVQFNPMVMPRKLSHKESKLDYSKFLRPERLSRATAFLDAHKELLIRIEGEYGVPKEIKVAILLVETDLGRYLGPDRAFNILASMAAATDMDRVKPWLPPELLKSTERESVGKKLKDKSQWAYEELRALLIYSEQNKIDPLGIKGSIFGAIGLCQFMPSNALRFGIDHDHDGKVDLFSKPDALASMANYIRNYGWKDNLSRNEQETVILRYNYSRPYARTILDVAERLSGSANE